MITRPHTFVFVGRSGCGKGTQSGFLKEYLGKQDSSREIFYLESGAAFREFINGEGYSHDLSREIYHAAALQPEFLTVWIWANLLINIFKENQHLIVDGTPRKFHEAAILESAFEFYRRKLPFVIHLNVSRTWSEERLLARGRMDDKNVDDIRRRLDWYDTEVVPAINFFREHDERYHFLDINGEQPPEKVFQDVIELVERITAQEESK